MQAWTQDPAPWLAIIPSATSAYTGQGLISETGGNRPHVPQEPGCVLVCLSLRLSDAGSIAPN